MYPRNPRFRHTAGAGQAGRSEGGSSAIPGRKLDKATSSLIQDAADALTAASSLREIFGRDITSIRVRVRESLSRALTQMAATGNDPGKLLDAVWRTVYYYPIQEAKVHLIKERKSGGDTYPEILLLSHIQNGFSFYTNLIISVGSQQGLELSGVVDLPLLTSDEAPLDSTVSSSSDSSKSSVAVKVVFDSLMRLGDLLRYEKELFPKEGLMGQLTSPDRYYFQALSLEPDKGMPHNQLGVLATQREDHLTAVYHYVRSALSAFPFEGAEANVTRELKRSADSASRQVKVTGPPSASGSSEWAWTDLVLLFLQYFREMWSMATSNKEPEQRSLERLSEDLLSASHQVLLRPVSEEVKPSGGSQVLEEEDPPPSLPPLEELLKVTGLFMALTHRLQERKAGSPSFYLSLAGTVGFFSHLLHRFWCDVTALFTRFGISLTPANEATTPGPTDDKEEEEKNKKKKIRRRRRRPGSDSDEETPALELSSSSSENEAGESDASESRSDLDEFSSDLSFDSDLEERFGKGPSAATLEKLAVLSEHPLLPVIKVVFHWLEHHGSDLPAECGVWACAVKLADALLIDLDSLEGEISPLVHSMLKESAPGKVPPLCEDVLLRGFAPLRKPLSSLEWETKSRLSLGEKEEALLRICEIRRSILRVASLEESAISLAEDGKLVLSKKESSAKTSSTPLSSMAQMARSLKFNRLSATLGQAWFQDALKESARRKWRETAEIPPYAVPDAQCLIDHLAILKQISAQQRCILVIPKTVLETLDRGKWQSEGAREASRWLEASLHRGFRFLRIQKPHEKQPLSMIRIPKKNRDASSFVRLLECCVFLTRKFTSESSPGPSGATPGNKPRVILVLGDASLLQQQSSPSSKGFSPVGLAAAVGVHLESIEDFHKRFPSNESSPGSGGRK